MVDKPEHPPRPTSRSPEVKRAAAIELAKDISRWCGDKLSESDVDDLTKMHWPFNGYEFAQQLENDWGLEPNLELVEILDAASTFDAERKAVAEWVSQNNVTLDLPDGTRATYDERIGTIRGRDVEHATYYFVPDDEVKKFKKGGGYIAAPEMLTVHATESA